MTSIDTMNTLRPSFRLVLLTAIFVIRHSSFVIAQGPLTPPGAPAPTMKTLDQLEARTPIASAPFTISTPGSYYLTANLTVTSGNAVAITADHVTLDLNGFAISSTASPASGAGVIVNGNGRNITIHNGHIRGTTTFAAGTFTTGGFQDGITDNGVNSANVRVVEVDVSGVANEGIDLADTVSTRIVEHCNVDVSGGLGIRAGKVRDCAVRNAGAFGVFADSVTQTTAESVSTNTLHNGIAATLVESSRGVAGPGDGITATTVSLCQGVSNAGNGIRATHVADSSGTSTFSNGILASSALNCFGASTGGVGIQAFPGTVTFCRGSRDGGLAINCGTAIGCSVAGTGVLSATNRFLGSP